MSQEDFEAGEFQAGSLSSWRPLVTRLGVGGGSPSWISRLQAHFAFSVTLNLFGFLSVSYWSRRYAAMSRAMQKSYPLPSDCFLTGVARLCLRTVCQQNAHIWVVSVSTPHQPLTKDSNRKAIYGVTHGFPSPRGPGDTGENNPGSKSHIQHEMKPTAPVEKALN